MVQRAPSTDHQHPEADHRHGDAAVEASRLGVRPGVQGPHHLAALVRVGAVVLRGQALQTWARPR